MTMIVVNVHEAKAKLSEYLEAAANGERVLICKRNRPMAELRAVETARTEPRPIGVARDRLQVPQSFFDPLPDDLVADFDLRPAPRAAERRGAAKVAERPATPYGPHRPGRRGR
jgi:prevent-host-death family protein